METAILGKTGLEVSRLGIGLAEIGSVDASAAESVLLAALDGGITFFDTAACYGRSEEWVGRALSTRRDAFVLATKAGHVTGGASGEEWTADTIRHSVERSLTRLKTDHVDLLQLHSCGLEVLKRGEAIGALLDARQEGKTRFIGYSGDQEAAEWAIECGHFDTLQTSFSVVSQGARRLRLVERADEAGMGIIIKRPIANAAWTGHSSNAAAVRIAAALAAMGPIPGAPEDPIAMSLGFTLGHSAIDTAIVGTRNPDHVVHNIAIVEEQPILPDRVIDELHQRFSRLTI